MKYLLILSINFIYCCYSFGQVPELVLPVGHTDRVNATVFSPDGKLVITGSADGSIKLWDANTGSMIKTLYTEGASINSIDYSPLRNVIVVGYNNGKAVIWDVLSGRILNKLEGHRKGIENAIFSPDGLWIATVSTDGSVAIWDAQTGGSLGIIKKVETSGSFLDTNLSIAFTPDSKKILIRESEMWTSKVHLIDLEENTLQKTFIISRKGGSFGDPSFVVSPNGNKMLLPCIDSSARMYDLVSGDLSLSIKGHNRLIKSACFSQSGNEILTTSEDGTAKFWDIKTGKLIRTFAGQSGELITADFSPDGKKLITGSSDGTAAIWDVKNGNILFLLKGISIQEVKAISFYSNDKSILTLSNKNGFPMIAKIWDTKTYTIAGEEFMEFNPETEKYFSRDHSKLIGRKGSDAILISYYGEILKTFPRKNRSAVSVAIFCPDQQSVMLGYWDNSIEVRELYGGNIIWSIEGDGDILGELTGILDINFSPNGLYAVTTSTDHTARIWNLEEGKIKRKGILVQEFKGHKHYTLSASFSAKNDKLVTTSLDETAIIWDIATGKKLHTLEGHRDEVNKAAFSNNGYWVTTTSRDKTNKVWDVKTGKEICSFTAINSNDYFTQIPSGYYQCTPAAAKLLHYVTPDFKVITFEQLDVKYNRPDKVLEAIGCPDTALITLYRKAYQKRIKKLGIDTTSFSDNYTVPEADFGNRDKIAFEQKDGEIRLHIQGKDNAYILDRFNLWVNENPLFGIRGLSLRNQNKNGFDTIITVPLSVGKNIIETSVFNINGIESYRKPLFVNYTPTKQVLEQVWFIGIGIDTFAESGHDLKWSAADIRNLSSAFKKKYGNNYHEYILLNSNVTIKNVIALKKWLHNNTSINDKVIVAYSGHGMFSKDLDYFLSTYNTAFAKPEKTGLPYDVLESLLDGIPARKKLMLIDACYSGEIDKEEWNNIPVVQQGIKNTFNLMQQIFVNVERSTGATVIAAAAGTQDAIASNKLKGGIFTYSILEKLHSPERNVTASELREYVSKRVSELTGNLQVPTTRSERVHTDWPVW